MKSHFKNSTKHFDEETLTSIPKIYIIFIHLCRKITEHICFRDKLKYRTHKCV